MNRAFLVVLLAAAATAAVISNEVPDVVEVPSADEVADVDVDEIPEVVVADMDELTDAVELTDEAVELQTATVTRQNLSQGNITSADTRVVNRVYRARGTEGQTKVRNVRIRTKRQISAIRVSRVGDSQNATPSIVRGGVGNSFVIIRIQSAVGRGYNYRVEVYVKKSA
ncbi:hypothetical protein PYW07_009519 [Mythimna separata]|uniref:Uncharacterized protein n=1 Tax=Mythimna separata TaxID=271217 RepID=A0AAD7YCN9_MYTSE|nr:hypothetical protein PYW07_009519 [Mythimna separata]